MMTVKWAKPLAAVAVFHGMAGPLLAQASGGNEPYGRMWGGGHMWDGGYGMGYGFFGGLMMVLFWMILIAVVVIAVRWWMDQGSGKRSSAMDILQERLAKGEIDAKEYAERKKALES
jgi:putative membrane protein